jgi:hypothetical protein
MQRHSSLRMHDPFRDELAGALGRIDQLEAENRLLRERLTHNGSASSNTTTDPRAQPYSSSPAREAREARAARPSRAALLLPLVTSWGLLMTAALVRFAAHGVDSDDRRSESEMYIRCGGVALEEAVPKAIERPIWSTNARTRIPDMTDMRDQPADF